MKARAFSLFMALALPSLSLAAKLPTPPATPKKPVADEYHGEKVIDDYRWLENGDDPEVQRWSAAQNARARAMLDAIPFRKELQRRVTQLLTWESPAYFGVEVKKGRVFALKSQPPKQQPMIVAITSLDHAASEKVVVDPNAIDPTGATSMDFYEPSHDGKYVAVSLSKGGTESGDVHVFEVATGKESIGDVVPRANTGTAGGTLAWNGDSTGFWYTRHPSETERPKEDLGFFQQVWFHKLGTPAAKDTYSIGKDFLRIAESFLKSSEDGRWVANFVQKGDGGEYELFLLDVAKNAWSKVASYPDQLKGVHFGPDDALWVLSRKDASRGKILRVPLSTPTLEHAKVVVPHGEATITGIEVTPHRLYVVEQLGGPSRLRVFDLAGKELSTVRTLPVSAVGGVAKLIGDDVLFANSSFIEPIAWYRYDSAGGKVTKTALALQPPADFSDIEVVREEATSKDGTKVPLSIVKPKRVKLNGQNPTLLTGYGGFSISSSPQFSKLSRAWLEQGGIIVQANIRGGGEFGEAWHENGYRTKKQNVFDDFIAVAKHVIDRKYTSPKKLAIVGGSNGGLLMGAAVTQAPGLFRVCVAHVGYFDMLRYETRPNGAFNTTEYGSVKNPDEFRALRAYSPFHRVKNGTKYPPMLLLTGANDPRVDPLHSRKMIARLQEAGAEAVLRTSSTTGHGGGTPLKDQIAQAVDSYGYMMHALGVKYRAPKAKPPVAPPK
jgi:prolyl oligopeptidase